MYVLPFSCNLNKYIFLYVIPKINFATYYYGQSYKKKKTYINFMNRTYFNEQKLNLFGVIREKSTLFAYLLSERMHRVIWSSNS